MIGFSISMYPFHLFLLYVLVHHLNCAQATSTTSCTDHEGKPECPETCFKPARIPHAKNFTCTVEIESLNISGFQEAKVVNNSTSTECKAPLLTGISLYHLKYPKTDKFSPTLNISFYIYFLAKHPEFKAVLLEFGSPMFVADKKSFTDRGFKISKQHGLAKRLFNFSTFQPDNYDVENPITIDFPCMYGLDDCNGGKIYIITLTALKVVLNNSEEEIKCFSDSCITCSQTSTISATPNRYNNWNRDSSTKLINNSENWYMTIATTIYPIERDVHVLIEKPNIKLDEYFILIRLMKEKHKVREKKAPDITQTSYLFKAVPLGIYTVEVLLCRHQGVCKYKYTTYHTVVVEGNDLVMTAKDSQIVLTSTIASVLGILLAIVFLIFLALCKHSMTKNSRNGHAGREIEERPYVIISNCDSASISISHVLALALTGLGLPNVYCPVTNSEALECIEDNTDTYLLILLPVEHKTFHFQISKDIEYEQTIKSIFSTCTKIRNVVLIYFPYMKDAKRTQWKFLRKYKRICLMRDFEKMMKLLNVQNNDSRILEKVRSDLIKATEEAKQMLISYYHTHVKTNPNVNVESFEMCQLHSHSSYQTHCPIHDQNLPSMHPHRRTCLCSEERYWFNNNSVRNYEISPLLDPNEGIIPPSPMPSIKDKPCVGYQRGDSGYSTSRMNSSSSNNNGIQEEDPNRELSLDDDDSLVEGMIMVNSSLLPQNRRTNSEITIENNRNMLHESEINEDIDRVLRINFF